MNRRPRIAGTCCRITRILEEHVGDGFEIDEPASYIEKVFPIRPDKRAQIPAITHVGGTGRLQSVSKRTNPLYRALINRFFEKAGVPINENEPMVRTHVEAISRFLRKDMDALVLGPNLIDRQRADFLPFINAHAPFLLTYAELWNLDSAAEAVLVAFDTDHNQVRSLRAQQLAMGDMGWVGAGGQWADPNIVHNLNALFLLGGLGGLAFAPDRRFCVLRCDRWPPQKNPNHIVQHVSALCVRLGVRWIAADDNGNGSVYNRVLLENLKEQGHTLRGFYGMLYAADTETPKPHGALTRWNIGRTPTIGRMFGRIKLKLLLFPQVSQSGSFLDDFVNVVGEFDDSNRVLRYTKPDDRQDDCVHATNYAELLAMRVWAGQQR